MNPVVVILGANGFIGRYLACYMAQRGREVVSIARSKKGWNGVGMFLEWDGKNPGPWALALEGAELVINLAGRSVNCRYTPSHRREILDSRLETTAVIGKAIAACRVPPSLWINSSTATWYRHAEDRPQDEWSGEPGEGFSCDVARAWEDAFYATPTPAETRKIALRTGMVMANEPGTVFEKLLSLTASGLGGTMAGGNQRVSWIHMDDFLRAIDFLIHDPFFSGPCNLTAPECPTNRDLMRELRNAVGMPLALPATRCMLEAGARLMNTETELITKSRWAVPLRLRDAGFRWHWPDFPSAVPDLIARKGLEAFFAQRTERSVGVRAWLPATTR